MTRRKEPRWLDTDFATYVNREVVAQSGGLAGVRDLALLDSALARGAQRWHYDPECDLADAVAAVTFGICKNHPFLDGNKRTAFQCAVVLLAINGATLDAPEVEVVIEMERLADGRTTEPAFAAWLRRNS